MFQDIEDSHAEIGKEPTPSSTFKLLVETNLGDQIVVNSNLQEDDVNSLEEGEDLKKNTSEAAQGSHVKDIKNDQQTADGGNK